MPLVKTPKRVPKSVRFGMAIGALAGTIGMGYQSIETLKEVEANRTNVAVYNEDIQNCIDSSLSVKSKCAQEIIPGFDLDNYIRVKGSEISDGVVTTAKLTVDTPGIDDRLLQEKLTQNSPETDRFTKFTSIFGAVVAGGLLGSLVGGAVVFGGPKFRDLHREYPQENSPNPHRA